MDFDYHVVQEELQEQLSVEMVEFCESNQRSVELSAPCLEKIKATIERCIKAINPGVFRLEVFGSFATRLSLPFSDLDLIVEAEDCGADFLERLSQQLAAVSEVAERKLISNASIPVLKLLFCLGSQPS